jgi:hypothetical protein
MEMLAATALEIATSQLEDEGQLFPFGLSIDAGQSPDDDDLNLHEPESEDDEFTSEDAMDGLLELFSETRDEYEAVALVFDAEMDEEWDAITVLIAHSSGDTIDVQKPYRISGRKRVWGEVEYSDGTLEVWD